MRNLTKEGVVRMEIPAAQEIRDIGYMVMNLVQCPYGCFNIMIKLVRNQISKEALH